MEMLDHSSLIKGHAVYVACDMWSSHNARVTAYMGFDGSEWHEWKMAREQREERSMARAKYLP